MTPKRFCLIAIVILGITGSLALSVEVRQLPLETSIKILRMAAPAAPAMPMRAMARPAPTPTTPQAKYPQYQLGHSQRSNSERADPADPRIRFFLNLPHRVLLVEVKITIDGQPFAMARQQRIARILREIKVGKDIALPVTTTDANGVSRPEATAPEPPASSNLADRLRHTMSVTGEVPSVEEVNWIISNWIDGPILMQLNDHFQKFRANQRPEFVILDRNHDGTVSAEELQLAVQSFQECDLNQDGLIQFVEIGVAAMAFRSTVNSIDSGNLITLLPDQTTAPAVYARLVATGGPNKESSAAKKIPRFDANGNGQFDPEELLAMQQAVPDVRLSVSFDTANSDSSRIAVTELAAEIQHGATDAKVDPTGIELMLAGTPVIFAAVQGPVSDQISFGAVNDGYPMLPSLDPDDDGRLTVRELRGLLKTLTTFDTNSDGALTIEEVQSPIRVCFGLGATVHRELAGIRGIHRKKMTTPIVGPEWFTRMDRNKDNDLTRGEFPGTDEQFRALDTDGDQLVSASEALEFDSKTERKPEADGLPLTEEPDARANDSNSKPETKP